MFLQMSYQQVIQIELDIEIDKKKGKTKRLINSSRLNLNSDKLSYTHFTDRFCAEINYSKTVTSR